MDLKLKGKVAMVAASSKGLGYGIAEALAQEGASCSFSRDGSSQPSRLFLSRFSGPGLTLACVIDPCSRACEMRESPA